MWLAQTGVERSRVSVAATRVGLISMLGKLIAGVIGGVLVAAFAVPLVGLLASQAGISIDRLVPALFLTVVFAATVFALLTKWAGKAWRYLLICAGTSAMVLSLIHISLAAANTSSAAGLVSFIAGVVLLLIGLLVGRDTSTEH